MVLGARNPRCKGARVLTGDFLQFLFLVFVLLAGFTIPIWLGLLLRLLGLMIWVALLPLAWSLDWPGFWRERRRKQARAVLAQNLVRLVANGRNPAYYEGLAESGMTAAKLSDLIAAHLAQSEAHMEIQQRNLMLESDLGQELLEMSQEQRKLLTEAEVELTRLRNQQRLLAGIVDRVKEKYLNEENP